MRREIDVDEVTVRLFGALGRNGHRDMVNWIRRQLADYKRYFERCRHPQRERVRGGYHGSTIKRFPLRYGSAEVEACMVCGGWRTLLHSPGPWQAGPYSVYRAQAIIDGDDL